MNKLFVYSVVAMLAMQGAFAMESVFDSMDKAVEVKMEPAKTETVNKTTTPASQQDQSSIQEERYTKAITSLDDAQVELRQQLTETTSKYNTALAEKKQAIAKCKAIKKELKAINKKMKNVDKSKKMINANHQKPEKKINANHQKPAKND